MDEFIRLISQWINIAIYVWGGQGHRITSEAQIRSMETSTRNADRAIALWKARGQDCIAFDCSGLFIWALMQMGLITYDTTANGIYVKCQKIYRGLLRAGDFLFRVSTDTGKAYHIGCVTRIENGVVYVIEAEGRDKGVIERPIDEVPGYWTAFGKNPFINNSSTSSTGGGQPVTVKSGSRGQDVLLLQTDLNELGYSLVADGIFGAKTDAAVRDFQAKHGLTVDGIVGTNTWNAIVAAMTPPPAPEPIPEPIPEPPAPDYPAIIAAKDAEIASLKERNARLDTEVSSLLTKVTEKDREIDDLTEEQKTVANIFAKYIV